MDTYGGWLSGLGGVDSGGGGNVPRKKFSDDAIDRMFRDPRQHGTEIKRRVESIQFASRNKAVEGSGPFATGIGSQK